SLLLTPALGSDGFSTLVNGLHLATDLPFLVANVIVSGVLLGLAWARGVVPGPGTVVQVVVVGLVVTLAMPLIHEPGSLVGRTAMLVGALPVLALGIALYLDSHLGAGPAEAPALAW